MWTPSDHTTEEIMGDGQGRSMVLFQDLSELEVVTRIVLATDVLFGQSKQNSHRRDRSTFGSFLSFRLRA